MRKFLLFIIVCICLTHFAFAEDKPIKFTETQKKTLENMVMGAQIAQNRIKEFVNYLVAEHKVDQTYQISQDMSGFEKVPQPPKLQSNRDEKDMIPIEQKPAEVKAK